MRHLLLALVALSLGVVVVGCGANNPKVQHAVVRRRAPVDMSCDALRIVHVQGDHWAAYGCGLKTIYNVNGMCSDEDNCDPALESGPSPEAQPVPAKR